MLSEEMTTKDKTQLKKKIIFWEKEGDHGKRSKPLVAKS